MHKYNNLQLNCNPKKEKDISFKFFLVTQSNLLEKFYFVLVVGGEITFRFTNSNNRLAY